MMSFHDVAQLLSQLETCAIFDKEHGRWVLVPHGEWGWFPETAWAMTDATLYTKDDLTKLMLGRCLTLDDDLPEVFELPLHLIRCLACAETFILREESASRHCDKENHRKLVAMTYGLSDSLPRSGEVVLPSEADPPAYQTRVRSSEEVQELREKLEHHQYKERQRASDTRRKLRVEYEAERRTRLQMDAVAAQVNTLNL